MDFVNKYYNWLNLLEAALLFVTFHNGSDSGSIFGPKQIDVAHLELLRMRVMN